MIGSELPVCGAPIVLCTCSVLKAHVRLVRWDEVNKGQRMKPARGVIITHRVVNSNHWVVTVADKFCRILIVLTRTSSLYFLLVSRIPVRI